MILKSADQQRPGQDKIHPWSIVVIISSGTQQFWSELEYSVSFWPPVPYSGGQK